MTVMHLAEDKSDGCVSSIVLAERGWTAAAVRRFLGEPDRTVPNPVVRSAAPMRMFRMERVTAAEKTEQWQRWHARSVQRSARGKALAEARRAALLAEIAALDIRVPVISPDALAILSVSHRNQREPAERATVEDADEATLRRWMVNYLRHATTVHDSTLNRLYARVGRAEATIAIRNTVYAVIAGAYPALADEARRQVARRS